jgi:four helix bundle protein
MLKFLQRYLEGCCFLFSVFVLGGMEKPFDLLDRTRLFAKEVQAFVGTLTRSPANVNSISQLIRSSSSVAANYLEAVDNLGKRDFLMKLRVARREARESDLWLDLLQCSEGQEFTIQALRKEAGALLKILSAMIRKAESQST